MLHLKSGWIILALLPLFSSAQYFQQEVNYSINVRLDDSKHELFADETIEYINNSPNSLEFIYFHIWPNAYKNNGTALAQQLLESGETKFYYSDAKDRGYIDQLDFKVNGKTIRWEYDPEHIDICKLFLEQPLPPGGKIIITTPFHVKVPKGVFSRLGHLGQAYQITQWYPKPAVYDQNGWHQMPYLNQGEFYSEYGSFDVSITLPKNYVVGSTGDLQNEEELAWLDQKDQATRARSWSNRSISDPVDEDVPESAKETKTLRYKQENIHDFAWFADKTFHVLKDTVTLPHSKKVVTVWSMFTNSEPYLWEKTPEYLRDAIYYYSLWNGDYPYNQATAVDGALTAGGGMEYPNVTVIGTSGSDYFLEVVIAHEVGHNWFYGILGSMKEWSPGWMRESTPTMRTAMSMLSILSPTYLGTKVQDF